MKVQEARIFGFLIGLVSGVTSYEYNYIISLSIGSMGLLSFFLGRKILKGPNGGLLEGVGMGLFFVTAMQTMFSII